MQKLIIYDAKSFFDTPTPKTSIFLLSRREREIVPLICRGFTNKAIAASLGMAHATVTTHIVSLMRTTKTQNRAELVFKILTGGINVGELSEAE